MIDVRSLVFERDLPYPPEKVWRALTQGHLIQDWLMDNDFEPVVGREFTFRSTPAGNWDGIIHSEVLAVEPERRLSYRWDSLGLESVVTWTLVPTGPGTHVRMEQSGFRPDQEAAYKGATYGWRKFIGGLARVLELQ